ncbi:hypothetical protein Tco_0951365 [Tanacetum coccineum]|uniref:Uncharacterized protein n=1 Tax=Tanacetum coccineum TaxID=301880 RepID=A0ABQ5DTX2_9ASTR
MRTRSQSRNLHHQQQAPPAFVEPFNLEEPIENPAPPVVPMADNRTMAQLLQAPTEGVNERLMQTTEEKVDSSKALDASLVIIDSNGTESQKQDTAADQGMMHMLMMQK